MRDNILFALMGFIVTMLVGISFHVMSVEKMLKAGTDSCTVGGK